MAANKELTAYKAGQKAKGKKGGGRKKFTLPLAVVLGFAPLVQRGIFLTRSYGFENAMQVLPSSLVPYNIQTRKIDFGQLSSGLYPIIAGLAVHKLAGAIGINRAMATAKIPWVRI